MISTGIGITIFCESYENYHTCSSAKFRWWKMFEKSLADFDFLTLHDLKFQVPTAWWLRYTFQKSLCSRSCSSPIETSMNVAALIDCRIGGTVTPSSVTFGLILILLCIGKSIRCDSRKCTFRIFWLTLICINHRSLCKILRPTFTITVSLRILFKIQVKHHDAIGFNVFDLRITILHCSIQFINLF